ncbi:MAG: hypothetical protein ACOYOU_17935 [Kiritimatiellia bacterium]
MKEEFQIHNLFRDSVERFLRDDPHLRRAAAQPFLYVSELVNTPAFLEPGIFMLTGGRQVGKTTCLKQFLAKLLRENRLQPDQVSFLTGDPQGYACGDCPGSLGRTYVVGGA